MKKGKFGIDLRFFAIVAFVFAFTGWTTALTLLLGYAILAEKDEWLSRQIMQATMLSLVVEIYKGIINLVKNFSGYTAPYLGYYDTEFSIGDTLTTWYLKITDIIGGVLAIVIAILVIVAIVNVKKGKDAGLPLFAGWACKAYGILPAAVAPPQYSQAQPQYQQPQQPAQQYQPQAPQYQQQPQYQPQQTPVAPTAPNDMNRPPNE